MTDQSLHTRMANALVRTKPNVSRFPNQAQYAGACAQWGLTARAVANEMYPGDSDFAVENRDEFLKEIGHHQ